MQEWQDEAVKTKIVRAHFLCSQRENAVFAGVKQTQSLNEIFKMRKELYKQLGIRLGENA